MVPVTGIIIPRRKFPHDLHCFFVFLGKLFPMDLILHCILGHHAKHIADVFLGMQPHCDSRRIQRGARPVDHRTIFIIPAIRPAIDHRKRSFRKFQQTGGKIFSNVKHILRIRIHNQIILSHFNSRKSKTDSECGQF